MKTLALLILLLCLMTVGCAGSLEEARRDGYESRVKMVGAANASVRINQARCDELDSSHRFWGAIGKGAAVLAGGAGVTTIPVKDERGEQVLAGSAVVFGAVAATAFAISEGASTSWARDCSSSP